MNPTTGHTRPIASVRRAWWLYAAVVLVIGIFGVRAFYLQIIQHDHYLQAAIAAQHKEHAIEPTRGTIQAYEGDRIVSLVLNEKRYTLFGDPLLVDSPADVAESVAAVLGGDTHNYASLLETPDTRYVVLARDITAAEKDAILEHEYPGIGVQERYNRIYPNNSLAAQLLGFVNHDGEGVYGIEQAMDEQLHGTPGLLKAVTDVHGVPLAASRENTRVPAVPGDDVVLTIDVAMQQRLENILETGLEHAESESGSALIMDPNTGAVKAMANLPTYNPADFADVEDPAVFSNPAVSASFEIGSIMKPLTAAAALDQGAVEADSSFNDPGELEIDGHTIRNVEEVGDPGRYSLQDILSLSMNTGATWLLMQMGTEQDEVTTEARERWHAYMTERYRLGTATGIEQGAEAEGYIPDPHEGFGLNLAYANTAFGQGMTATLVQMGAAFSSIVNGGTYYQPFLVDRTVSADDVEDVTQPNVLERGVVSERVSRDMRNLLNNVVQGRSTVVPQFNHDLYSVGGKTGTAEIADPDGGYFTDQFNGTFIGYVGGDEPEYVIVVRVNKPQIGGYAGTTAAQPVFVDLAHMLIDDFGVTPRGR